MIINRIIYALVLIAVVDSARADWTVHTVSEHIGQSGFNNVNPGLGYDYTPSLRVGGLYNSFERPSFYAVGIYNLTDSFRIGAGVISGYVIKDWEVGQGDHDSIIPIIAMEYDISDHVSIAWFGTVLNLELKF